jgi:hypothetical protein
MKYFLLITIAILLTSCCSVEERIKHYSYTNEWYYKNNLRFQVCKTKNERRYIIVLNKNETRFKREYIKTSKN